MSFQPERVDQFLELFEQNKSKIRNVEGCSFLELYRDKTKANVFFTYSHWRHDNDLENYRNSSLFGSIWKQTKALFDDRPEAWSLDLVKPDPRHNELNQH